MLPGQSHYHGRIALSAAGSCLPDVSRRICFPLPFPPLRRSSSLFHSLSRSERRCGLCCPSMRDPSSACSSSSSSSTSSPSALMYSGGSIQSLGTTQGSATPMLAARFSHPGPASPVSFLHRYDVKWLQFFVSRLYEVPRNSSEASRRAASISSDVASVKPCRISHLKVPPGGSVLGFVQYTPVTPRLSWPPYAYSRPLMTTPE